MANGVKVVGGPVSPTVPDPPAGASTPDTGPTTPVGPAAPHPGDADAAARGRRDPARRRPRRWVAVVLACLAALGIAGTVGFGLAWASQQARVNAETEARTAARSFLVDLTNFDAKTVDADFGAITSMATGPFASQAQRFFNSSIRQDLEKALASSRGQVRALYVQSYASGRATVYAVVDQLYANDKVTSPQTDVLRIVLSMAEVAGRWRVADVTVLQGPALPKSSSSSPSKSG
jgi:hypothetical protein